MMVVVCRCPECGSLDAFCDESRSIVDISCMQCRACGHYDYCDSWQRDFDWFTEIEVERVDKLPDKVEPLPFEKRFYSS